MRVQTLLVAATVTVGALVPGYATAGGSCSSLLDPSCHTVSADQQHADFHGLIMVPGQPSVLDVAAHSGTEPGCGDCEWTVILACLHNGPGDPASQGGCAGAGNSAKCDKHQSLFRIFLTTKQITNALAAEVCLGGIHDIVPVSDLAAADVDRYLHVVHPPDLVVTVEPPHGVLAGLPAYVMARPPTDLAPQPFGGGAVTETITIAPLHYTWAWGDGTAPTVTDDPGGPYPDGDVTHTYVHGGHLTATLTAQWGASYTISVAGQTFGPYDAAGGLVDHTQQVPVDVATAHSHLVSG